METPTPKFANLIMHSDIRPFEVIEARTDKKLIIREMGSRLVEGWFPDIKAGGFLGFCVNNDNQEYKYFQAPANSTIEIRLHKDGKWRDPSGDRYSISDHPVRFHDYNF